MNFRKLVADLADMYHFETFDVVVTELTANALDAGAHEIAVDWDGAKNILVMTDDGRGMNADEFEQYHDLAAELKTRGDGIGFAGVGAKISFNIAHRALTETRHEGKSRASDWYWGRGNTLRWNPVAPGRLRADGTRVEIHFDSKRTPRITDAHLAQVLHRHYRPLFITDFAHAYRASKRHAATPRFKVNGHLIPQTDLSTDAALVARKDYEIKVGAASVGWGALGVPTRKAWQLGDILHRLQAQLTLHGCKLQSLYDHLQRHAGLHPKRAAEFAAFRRHLDDDAMIPRGMTCNRIVKSVKPGAATIASQSRATGGPRR